MSFYFKNNHNKQSTLDSLFSELLSFDSYDELPAPSNIISNDESIEIHLQAPGIPKDKIQIDFQGNLLKVSHEPQEEKDKPSYIQQQIFNDGFKNSFKMQADVDEKNISATMDNGILKIKIPLKKEKTKSRIKIT